MDRAKKFGTFGGVYTPSLLTILGVIMYLRLGWIVGQAGLIYTIGIILIAHVISVTTGLSLSSIATDKKMKAGGIYYILSRSLGLPMGGAIGITIFAAITLSISLYLVGFSESFLAVDAVREFFGLEQDVNSYRITGTVMLVLLTIVAFISTSLAIRVQYLVLTAIILSLASIVLGFILNTGFHPSLPSVSPLTTAPSPDVLFAIFFPAVTGFTVGVAMSGDLKDPRFSIPRGTLLAIFTGMIVYIGLAVGFALFVERDLLLEDSAFLMRIAFIPLLVLAGIWGATLSSALGGILGGPRIVQALAKDKLAPGMLSKGYGINNEPRTAILLTFIIAQAGILIGDLNTIARVVSMFFIAAYGFINLAFALESWASTDFRPSFRIPRWVGWLGFGASLMVMVQIDIVAMFIAFLLIWLVWFAMKQRELQLEPGDVWQSVWASIVRQAIQKMHLKGIEERNWKPNILLFSGNPATRPGTVELGKALIANHGLLTIVNIKQPDSEKYVKPRPEQKITTLESNNLQGVFAREYQFNDLYKGIETISETYGFAGVEPNTVFLGWPGNSSDPSRYVNVIKHIINLDLNLLIMNFDQERKFGKRNTIDIWWRGAGNNGNLAINLVKFLWLSEGWKDSKLRLMIENPINDERENVFAFASEVLDNLRVNAEIMIINNEIEKRPFYDIIRIESRNSDIVFVGMPEIETGQEPDFIDKTNKLFKDLGTVVLIKASTQFKRLNIGIKHRTAPLLDAKPDMSATKNKSMEKSIKMPGNSLLARELAMFMEDNNLYERELFRKTFGKILDQYAEIVGNAETRVNTTFAILEKKLFDNSTDQKEKSKTIYKLNNNTYSRYEQILNHIKNTLLPENEKNLSTLLVGFDMSAEEMIRGLPEKIEVVVDENSVDPVDVKGARWLKRQKFFGGSSPVKVQVKFRKILSRYYPVTWQFARNRIWQSFSGFSRQYLDEQQKAFKQLRDCLHVLENAFHSGDLTREQLNQEKDRIEKQFSDLKSFISKAHGSLEEIMEQQNHASLQAVAAILNSVNPNLALKDSAEPPRLRKNKIRNMAFFPGDWKEVQTLFVNQNLLEITLSGIEYRLWHFTGRISEDIKGIWMSTGKGESALALNSRIIAFTQEGIELLSKGKTPEVPEFKADTHDSLQQRIREIEDFNQERIHAALSRTPGQFELLKPGVVAEFTDQDHVNIEKQSVEVAKLLHFIVQSDLLAPMQKGFRKLDKQLQEMEQEIQEISQLIRITFLRDEEEPMEIPLSDFLAQQKDRAVRAQEKINGVVIQFDDQLRNAFHKATAKLTLSVFLKTAENLRLLEKDIARDKERKNIVVKWIQSTREFIRKHLVRLWYDRSKRIVYAKQFRSLEAEESFPVSKIHLLNEFVSFREKVMQKVPPYYQQLFLRKNNYFMDFWHGKPRELEEAERSIGRHKRGYNGAILVRGEHNSGKTFFVNYMVHKYLEKRPVFSVSPPFAGSSNPSDFLRALQKATDMQLNTDTILKNLPEHSVLILEDLELWWEKTTHGLEVIKKICKLIEKYGHQVLFVITVNSHAYKSINRFLRLDNYLLSTIDCNPFNAEEIRNIILQRHRSGNMQFVLNGKKEQDLRSWDYARLFNTYFNYTRGNVGLSLQTWMACIVDADENSLQIRPPRRPDTSVLNNLNSETLVFLVQFILHKRLSYEKIQRIMMMSADEVSRKIALLKRAAIVTEPNRGVFTLNPNLHAFIRERFIEKELL